MIKVTRKVQFEATMTVFEPDPGGAYHRLDGPVDPSHAAITGRYDYINEALTALQEAGVIPGTELKITIEEK